MCFLLGLLVLLTERCHSLDGRSLHDPTFQMESGRFTTAEVSSPLEKLKFDNTETFNLDIFLQNFLLHYSDAQYSFLFLYFQCFICIRGTCTPRRTLMVSHRSEKYIYILFIYKLYTNINEYDFTKSLYACCSIY